MPENSQDEKQKKLKTISFIQPWRIFAIEAFLFFITSILGIITAFKLSKFLKIQEITLPTISLWDFISFFLLITLFILFFTFFKKFKKGRGVIYKGLFVLAVFWGGAILLSLWLSDIPAMVVMGLLIFFWFKKPRVYIHNLVIILGLAGAGSILGLELNPKIVIVLLVIFSIYDFIAVYKTKHMIKMAKEMIERGAILGLIIPLKISDFKEDLKEVKLGGKFLILGGGDVVFPLLLAVSLVSEGILNSLIITLFALIGLSVSFWLFISQKTRQPIPALPPIALFSIIGYLITRLI